MMRLVVLSPQSRTEAPSRVLPRAWPLASTALLSAAFPNRPPQCSPFHITLSLRDRREFSAQSGFW